MAYGPDAPPLQYQDAQTGAFTGIVRNIFTQLEQNCGLRFHYVPMPLPRAVELAEKNEIDVLACLTGDFLQDKSLNLRTSRPYLRSVSVRLSRGDIRATDEARVALQEGLLLSAQAAAALPGRNIVQHQSLRACLDDLTGNRVDAVYTNLHMARALLAEPPYAGLRVEVQPHLLSNLRMGVAPQADSRIFSILDKCLQALPPTDIDGTRAGKSARHGQGQLGRNLSASTQWEPWGHRCRLWPCGGAAGLRAGHQIRQQKAY